jgi:pimeloyl-ACP methyl ester carboxylesterase
MGVHELHLVRLAGGLDGVETAPAPGGPVRAPVLMVHGMMAGAWQFERLQQTLTDAGHRTLAVNYRGHHGSRPVDDLARVSVVDYARDALAGCHHLGGRPVVVGQSMGGLVALMLAQAGAVSAVVLVCALPPGGIIWRTNRPASAVRSLWAVLRRRPLVPHRKELDGLIFNGLPEAERPAAFERQVPESSRAFVEIALGRIRIDPRLVTCPVLSVTTGADNLVRPSVGRRIARRYRGEHLHFEQAAHYAIAGEPSAPEVCDAIAAWVG